MKEEIQFLNNFFGLGLNEEDFEDTTSDDSKEPIDNENSNIDNEEE